MALSQEFRERSQDTSALQGAKKLPSGTLRAEDVEAVHLRALATDVEMDAHNRTVQVLSQSTGMDASNVLGGFRARTGAEAAMQMQMRDDDKKKSDAEDVTFLALLEDLAALEAQIAENERQMEVLRETMEELSNGDITVEEAMSREVVMDAIRDWEERTGRSFDPANDDAADLLMTIMNDQHDIIAADTVLRHQEHDRIVNQVRNDFDSNYERDPSSTTERVKETTDQGLNQSWAVTDESQVEEVLGVSDVSRDGHSEDFLREEDEAISNDSKASALKSRFGSSLESLDGAATSDFQTAAADTQKASSQPSPGLDPATPGMG